MSRPVGEDGLRNGTASQATVAFADETWRDMVKLLAEDLESAAVLAARIVSADELGRITLLVRSVHILPEHSYQMRKRDELALGSEAWLPIFGSIAESGCVPVFVHTHPSNPRRSGRDEIVDDQLAEAAHVRSGRDGYGSLILAGTADAPTFTGRLRLAGRWEAIERIRVVGRNLQILTSWTAASTTPTGELFDRQIRAFGQDGQEILGALRVAVVGGGGTGSAVFEQLLRLGVGTIGIIDPDCLEITNVSRVYGSTIKDTGHPKVLIAEESAARTGIPVHVEPVQGSVLDEHVMRRLLHYDVVIGCTDDHAGRGRLTRLPGRMLQLLLDIGVLVDAVEASVLGIRSRLTIVAPRTACLFCTRDIDPRLVAAEEMNEHERAQRAGEGYAPGLGEPAPAVVAFTTFTAALAVSELLERIIGWGESNRPTRVIHHIADHHTTLQRLDPSSRHWCASSQHLADGPGEPLLGIQWRQGEKR
jgi:molybdopterin/thiamine biosynthesis adenylyltransferase